MWAWCCAHAVNLTWVCSLKAFPKEEGLPLFTGSGIIRLLRVVVAFIRANWVKLKVWCNDSREELMDEKEFTKFCKIKKSCKNRFFSFVDAAITIESLCEEGNLLSHLKAYHAELKEGAEVTIGLLSNPLSRGMLSIMSTTGAFLKGILGYIERKDGRRAPEMYRKVTQWISKVDGIHTAIKNDDWSYFNPMLKYEEAISSLKEVAFEVIKNIRQGLEKYFGGWLVFPLKMCSISGKDLEIARKVSSDLLAVDLVTNTIPSWAFPLLSDPLRSNLLKFSQGNGNLEEFPPLFRFCRDHFSFCIHNIDCERPISLKNSYHKKAHNIGLDRMSAYMRSVKNATELSVEDYRKYLPIARRQIESSERRSDRYIREKIQPKGEFTEEELESFIVQTSPIIRPVHTSQSFIPSRSLLDIETSSDEDENGHHALEDLMESVKGINANLYERSAKNFKIQAQESINIIQAGATHGNYSLR